MKQLTSVLLTFLTFACAELAYAQQATTTVVHPDYYIGAQCVDVPEILETHLNLGKGLLVQSLVAKGPADKAGIKHGDIILSIGGKDIQKVEDILSVLNDGKDKEQTVVVLQNGAKKELKVQPEKRPESFSHVKTPSAGMFRTLQPGIIFDGKDSNEARNLIKKFIEQMDAVGINAEEVEPNGLLPNPGNTTVERFEVSIMPGEKPGTQRIHVRQNNEVWEVEKIEDLPKELQEKVREMFNPMQGGWSKGISDWADYATQGYNALSEKAKKEYDSLLSNDTKKQLGTLSSKTQKELGALSEQARKEYDSLSEQAKKEYNALSEQAKKEYDSLSEQAKKEYHSLSEQVRKEYHLLQSSDAWKSFHSKTQKEFEALENEMKKAYEHAPDLKNKFDQYRKSTQDYLESFWKTPEKEEKK